jgi:hypothetical protein
MRNAYKILFGNPEGKRPFGRPRCIWEDIRTDLTEIGWAEADWTHLGQDKGQWRALRKRPSEHKLLKGLCPMESETRRLMA